MIENGVDHAKEGDHSIGSWVDDHYHEIYAVDTAKHEPEADELHEGFTTEELLNHQEHLDTDSLFAEACGRGTCSYHPFTRAKRPSIDNKAKPPFTASEKTKQNNNYLTQDEFGIIRDPEGYARAMDGHALQVSREELQTFFRWLMEQRLSSWNNATPQSTIGELQRNPTTQLVE